MTGERHIWYKIADRKGCSISEAMSTTLATEFWGWIVFYEKEYNDKKIEHWYLAQVACEINRLIFAMCAKEGDKNQRPNIKDFLLEFSKPEILTEEQLLEKEEASKQWQLDNAKRAWFAMLGIGKDGQAKKGKKKKTLPEKVMKAMENRKKKVDKNV